MRVAIGADHRGFQVRAKILALVQHLGHEAEDMGTDRAEIVLYPDIAAPVARKVSDGDVERGILVGRTGLGMCIVANKFPGVRAAVCQDEMTAETSRRLIDVNVLCLSAELLSESQIERIVRVWLATLFEGGRHNLRLERIRIVEREVARRQSGST